MYTLYCRAYLGTEYFLSRKKRRRIPRPKHLASTAVETQQPSSYSPETPRRDQRKKGKEGRVKGEQWGEPAQKTERRQVRQPDGTSVRWRKRVLPKRVYLTHNLTSV
jgi:hypothetical protein